MGRPAAPGPAAQGAIRDVETDFQTLCQTYARSLAEELSGLLGVEARVQPPKLSVVDREGAAGDGPPLAYTQCAAREGEIPGGIHWLASQDGAVVMAGLLLALDADAIAERRKAGLDPETLDAFGEVMNLAVAIWSRVGEEAAMPALQREATRVVESPGLDEGWLCEGRLLRARFGLALPDQEPFHLDLLVPDAAVQRYFGESLAEAEEALAAAPAQAIGGEEEGGRVLVVIDADEADRAAAEEIAAALGLEAWPLDPAELDTRVFADLHEVRAVLVGWDLGILPGVDVVEALRRCENTAGVAIALASPEPTRSKVRAALRSGADTFLRKPWDASEIARRLGLSAPAEPPDAGSEPGNDG